MLSKKHKVIFLMPPKTASQALTEVLLDSSIVFDKIQRKPKIHLTLSELVDEFEVSEKELSSYKIVQVVRDPYERYISSFLHQMRLIPASAPNMKIRGMDIDIFSEHLVKSLMKPNFLKNFYGNTNFIKKNLEAGKNWSGTRAFMAQADWNDLGAEIKHFKLEDIKDSMESISDYLGIYLPDMAQKNVSITEKSPDMYSQFVYDTVTYLYRIDFETFGYDLR
jgi:hypothetical protein